MSLWKNRTEFDCLLYFPSRCLGLPFAAEEDTQPQASIGIPRVQAGEAISELRKTISQKPNYAEAHNTLGLLLRENGKREDQRDRQESFRSD